MLQIESMFVFPESGIDYEQDATRRHEVRLAFLPEEISRLDPGTLILIGDDLRQLGPSLAKPEISAKVDSSRLRVSAPNAFTKFDFPA